MTKIIEKKLHQKQHFFAFPSPRLRLFFAPCSLTGEAGAKKTQTWYGQINNEIQRRVQENRNACSFLKDDIFRKNVIFKKLYWSKLVSKGT
jgi:hypothetical protein